MASVQFYGVEQVMAAAENLKQPAWAIHIDGKLFSKCELTNFEESMQMLIQNLEMLERGNSNARYTLKFFESDGKQIKINEKTTCDAGSFNFKLVDPEERQQRMIGYQGSNNTALEKKIADLEKRLEEKEAEEPEENESLGSIVKGFIRNPAELAQLVNIGRVLMGKAPVASLEGIGSVVAETAGQPIDENEKLTRLGHALDVLEKADPRLVEHLEKLAKMASDNPQQFLVTTSILDT